MKNFKKLSTVLFAAALVFSAGVYFSTLFISDNHTFSYLRSGQDTSDLEEMNRRHMDQSEVTSPTSTPTPTEPRLPSSVTTSDVITESPTGERIFEIETETQDGKNEKEGIQFVQDKVDAKIAIFVLSRRSAVGM